MKRNAIWSLAGILLLWWWLPASPATSDSDDLRTIAIAQAGKSYRSGGQGPEGFDCSGLMSYIFAEAGRDLPRDSRSQAMTGEPVDLAEAAPGDLIFFRGQNLNSDRVGHVGMVVAGRGDSVVVVHACNRGVVREAIFQLDYYRKRFLFLRRT